VRRALRHLHINLGHPSNNSLARAIRLSGGSDATVAAAQSYRRSVCSRLRGPSPALPARLNPYREFGDCVALDLFELADYNGYRQLFLNCVDLATRFQIVAAVESRSPSVVFHGFMQNWCRWAGPPNSVLTDLGGEFMREFGQEIELMGTRFRGVSPTQNAPTERRGGAWKYHARRLCDDFSDDFGNNVRRDWMITTLNCAVTAMPNESGYSPSQ